MGSGVVSIGRRLSARAAAFLALGLAALFVFDAAPAVAQEPKRILLYTGTTGFRHADAIRDGRFVMQRALEGAGYTVDWEDCDNNGSGTGNCNHANKNPRIFTDDNLARYDAMLLLNASSAWAGGNRPGPLWNADQWGAIIRFVQNGGGIAALHNSTDMSAGAVTHAWWDGSSSSAIGTLMKGHAATNAENRARVEVADRHHSSTRELPDSYRFGDEHYNFARSVRGTHHVLATLDERSYEPGSNAMGPDHPISWCRLYDGANVVDGTDQPKPYDDGRVWATGMGHFGSSFAENGGNNNLVRHILGGVAWVAGGGDKSDCSGTVWSNFRRTVLVDDVHGPIGLDVAADGKVYWSEIGQIDPAKAPDSEGYVKMHDPEGPANNKTTVVTIPTRADHGNSEDGVLGMTLEPDFDLSDPAKRDVYVYYSPRNPAWPVTGDQIVVGYNQISRFTLNAEGTAAMPGSERVILRVPKAKISGNPRGFPGGPQDSGPGHVGGAGMDFDSQGNLYLGVGDDVSPNASGHDRTTPMDYRASERWDARKTSANTADLRGKLLRIKPREDIPTGTEPAVNATYSIPSGNMFPLGTPQTRPEIYAMGFRQPFTVQADPKNPGSVVVGEYCHDKNTNTPFRAPAGICEWNKIDEPGFHGWPFCMGDNAPINTTWRWNYAANARTGEQYDCSTSELPSDINYAPEGQTSAPPTFQGRETLPGPAKKATIWKKYLGPDGQPPNEGRQNLLDFGDLEAGGQQPITGPVYRYDADTAGPNAFPAYYDGAWLIANRGDDNGFWKEVRLRSDDNEMLRVNDWVPPNRFGSPNSNPVIPTRFGADGALYMARWGFGCCRNQLTPDSKTQLIKVDFAIPSDCSGDTQAPTVEHSIEGEPHPTNPGTYLGSATVMFTAGDVGCAGVDAIEYRVNSSSSGAWRTYSDPVQFTEARTNDVDYRARDKSGNVSEIKRVTFTVAPRVVHDVNAQPTTWDPTSVSVGLGEAVTWHFPTTAQFPHDVWLVPPGRDPSPTGGSIFQVTTGPVNPGGPSVSYTFGETGAWTYICRLHSSFGGGAWQGMVGTVNVGSGGPGADPGPNPNDTNNNNNTTTDTNPGPQSNPQTQPQPGPSTDRPTAASITSAPSTTVASFLSSGLRLSAKCESGQRGTVSVRLSRREARKLGLRGATTLAKARVTCGSNDALAVRLRASAHVKQALRKARGSVAATVSIKMGSGRTATSASRRLVLKAGR
jgi:plastocyanin